MTTARNRLMAIAIRAARLYWRSCPVDFGKEWLWRRFGIRHVFWSSTRFLTRTEWGGTFECSAQDFIQRYLLVFGIWEPCLTRLLMNRLKPGEVFIDVGANVGYFAVLASKLVGPEGSVVAIEASPATCALLRKNIELNRLTNVRILNKAVTDRPGYVRIEQPDPDNLALVCTTWENDRTADAAVPADTLKELLTEDEWKRARFIKIDIEGGETAVLPTVLKAIDSLPQNVEIVAELSDKTIENERGTGGAVFRAFTDSGFHAYALENSYSNAYYFKRNPALVLHPLTEVPSVQTDVLFSRSAGLAT